MLKQISFVGFMVVIVTIIAMTLSFTPEITDSYWRSGPKSTTTLPH